jgi:UDP-glucose 4-epimerase
MNIFVTGGTGFIGQHVTQQLIDDDHNLLLMCLENEDLPQSIKKTKKATIIRGNLSTIESLKKDVKDFGPEATVHMAWEGIPNYDYEASTKNLIYGLNLIAMLADIGCKRVLCTGSCWEYGKKSGKLDEDSVVTPSNAFTAAKNSLHLMGREIAKENNMKFIWTRLFYVYGPGQKGHSLIPHIINAIRLGSTPNIKTPNSRNDFVYVKDVANAISLLSTKEIKGEIYNIGSGHSTEITDIINMVYHYYGSNNKYNPAREKSNDLVKTDFWADVTRIKKDIGWEPKFSIEKGIEKTIEYFK